jgi:ArsR family metal-binding transcriptional regulator
MLIEDYDLDVFTPPCSPGTERFCAIVRVAADISAVLPYLNATLRGAKYNPSAPALTWRCEGRAVVFGADQIAIGDLEDRAEAERVARGLVDLANRTWAQRDEIAPDHTAYRRAAPMDVYRLLPRTNCKACGQATCFNFALKLLAGQASLEQCAPLLDSGHADHRAQLRALLPRSEEL